MAAPVDAGRATTNVSTAASPWTVNLPGSIASGDLLVMFLQVANGRSVTATGWTQFVEDASDGSADNHIVLYRVADGSEGATVSVALTGGTGKGAAIVWRVTGAKTSGTILTSATVVNQNANIDPASASTDGGTSADVLSIVMGGVDGETQTFSAAPSGYSNLQTANSGTGSTPATNCVIGGATKGLTAVTSENPGAFTNSAPTTANGGTGFTVLVHAAASGTTETPTPGGAVVGGVGPVARALGAVGGVLSAGSAPAPRTPLIQGGVVANGITPAPRVSVSTGGAIVSGNSPIAPLFEIPVPGGAVASGSPPVARATSSAGGATASGNAPTTRVISSTGGATCSGSSPSARVGIISSGALVGGLGASVRVSVSTGGVLVGGNSPATNLPTSETPAPGGAQVRGNAPTPYVAVVAAGSVVGGRSPVLARASASAGGVLVGGQPAAALQVLGVGGGVIAGVGPTARVLVSPGGVLVGGVEPGEPTMVKIVDHFDQPSPTGGHASGSPGAGMFDSPSPSVG